MGKLKSGGRSFDCETCPERTKKLRRCREDREDFKHEDNRKGNVIFPIRLKPGGEPYGFCPAKATWTSDPADLLNLLTICAETGQMPYEGGLFEQPDWFVDLMGWFVPKNDLMKFSAKADMILGGDETPKVKRR